MTPEMMVVTDLDGQARRRRAGPQALVRDPDAPGGLSRAAGRRRRRPRASAALDRIRRGRHSARSRRARRGRDDARQHSDCGVRHAVDARAGGRRSRRTSRRTTACCWPITARSRSATICSRAYYKMETIEHFARISLVARMLGREHLLSREEVERLQGLRGTLRHRRRRRRSARIRPRRAGDPSCQVVVAPSAPGERLVPDTSVAAVRAPCIGRYGRRDSANIRAADGAHRRGRQAAWRGRSAS